ncbi:MAG: hypothetical protein AVDCRST_MAG61-580, partial [uncultured Friedmanniella sp.]
EELRTQRRSIAVRRSSTRRRRPGPGVRRTGLHRWPGQRDHRGRPRHRRHHRLGRGAQQRDAPGRRSGLWCGGRRAGGRPRGRNSRLQRHPGQRQHEDDHCDAAQGAL